MEQQNLLISSRLKHQKKARLLTIGLILTFVLIFLFGDPFHVIATLEVKADNVYFNLTPAAPLRQNWSDAGLITVNNDWSGVPSINGYSGQINGTGQDLDPQTLLADYSSQLYVFANITNPNSPVNGAGGTALIEFEISDPVVGFRGSPLHDAPNLDIRLNTTGCAAAVDEIHVSYNLRDIDGGGNDTAQRVALQYRVGETGDYTNLPAGYIADATTGPNQATLVTPVAIALPFDAKGAPQVHVRIVTGNATGVDEYVGIDDLNISCVGPTAAAASVSGRITDLKGKGVGNVSLTLTGISGETHTVRTNIFGYYRFEAAATGQTYILQLSAKKRQFAPDRIVLNLNEEITGLNFTAFD